MTSAWVLQYPLTTLANNNKKMLALIAQEFNTITAENDMKWEMMRPSLDQWNWKLADRFVDFGSRNQMLMVGHALVWHAQIPDSVFLEMVARLNLVRSY
jgi:endo-1,4-beta-xylanase